MRRIRQICRFGLIGLTVLLLVWFFSPVVHWSGAYTQAVHILHISDSDGQPIEGCFMRIIDEEGKQHFGFPITNLCPTSTLVSDSHGEIACVHLGLASEFGGKDILLLGFWRVALSRPREFCCELIYKNDIIARVDYNTLERMCSGGESATTVQISPETLSEAICSERELAWLIARRRDTTTELAFPVYHHYLRVR